MFHTSFESGGSNVVSKCGKGVNLSESKVADDIRMNCSCLLAATIIFTCRCQSLVDTLTRMKQLYCNFKIRINEKNSTPYSTDPVHLANPFVAGNSKKADCIFGKVSEV